MKTKTQIILLAISTLIISSCVSTSSSPTRVDEIPMYGGMDRKSDPRIVEGDRVLIEGASKAFGGRKAASKQWVSTASKYYAQGSRNLAMRRFNQAWLLDPKNPNVYNGFGVILKDRKNYVESRKMFERAYKLGLRDPLFMVQYTESKNW